jgi:hypothetical protein
MKRRADQPGTLVGVRLQPDPLAALDAWIAAQPDTPSRPEAVRRLLGRALAIEGAIQATDAKPRRTPRV